ncbi:RanGTP-binding protein-domain-containing protein [Microdochium bolleyi]|uniref:RanGTP-binding protein-domain-containing protein n=1 Tax=Microdochium bolleyi TaxID=196109 RepID=A0A136IY11_9PEZI|nr:RanGTP-binding protein-domain-containing protein [Microdochium bolleyi]
MDALLAKLSYHATSFAIRSCLALTSKYVAKHAGSLLKTVDDGPLRQQFVHLQRRLARKIELLSPILESIDVRFAQGETNLEAIIKISHELRQAIDALEARILITHSKRRNSQAGSDATLSAASTEVLAIVNDIKDLIANIDDAVPLVNLWISSLPRPPTESTPFSPSRLLQASMLLNIADTQYILDPSRPMQVGPDFGISLYMLFRGHASLRSDEEPYGIEEGQRKPLWQQVMRKARIRLYRIPEDGIDRENQESHYVPAATYKYHLQIVEDLDDGLLHTPDRTSPVSTSYDGVAFAGLRQAIPIADISKLLYTEIGSLLNIVPDDEKRSNPVLLLKREANTSVSPARDSMLHQIKHEEPAIAAAVTEDEVQSEIDQQLFGDFEVAKCAATDRAAATKAVNLQQPHDDTWRLPANLDPEWMALEVYIPDEDGCGRSDSSQTSEDLDQQGLPCNEEDAEAYEATSDVDTNLCSQFARMSMIPLHQPRHFIHDADIAQRCAHNLIKRSPFGAITTSLSLLEMLLRLTSLQEFEQKTHLAVPDRLLRFYLDESASTSGLHGPQRVSAKREAEAKMGFDPYTDSPGMP